MAILCSVRGCVSLKHCTIQTRQVASKGKMKWGEGGMAHFPAAADSTWKTGTVRSVSFLGFSVFW